ncbi:MAG: O-acetyl-ADP-ribose deacetylase [Clostridia bacterium]|nr:O-acetyl-ADP-ribose deacetylase [Clostridia bacterium]
MPLKFIRQDITTLEVDAIVNAANGSLLGGGGVDGAIHRAAGPGLLAECRTLGGCRTGEAKITGAYRLKAKYIIHTVGPVWQGGGSGERELLFSCYIRSLGLARDHGCESVAFPLISSGAYGFPKREALNVAEEAISAFLEDHDMEVFIVIFDKKSFAVAEELKKSVESFIDDKYSAPFELAMSNRLSVADLKKKRRLDVKAEADEADALVYAASLPAAEPGLSEALKKLDESFSQSLLRLIDERGLTDAQCYKKANVDRKLFSKIRSDRLYRPSKPTVLAFAVALELDLEEAESLLKKAGFALSHSSKADVIIEYFIKNRIFDIMKINETLFEFDQPLLGA